MHKLFCTDYEQVSYDIYRQAVKKLNIGCKEGKTEICRHCLELDLDPTEDNIEVKKKNT